MTLYVEETLWRFHFKIKFNFKTVVSFNVPDHVNLLEAAKDLAHLTPPHLHPHHRPAPTPSTDVILNSQPIH